METTTALPAAPKGVVLFDGDCPFCQKTVAMLKKLDWRRRLAFHNCRDLAGIPDNTADLQPARLIEEMHLLTPDRRHAYSGFRAVRWILGRLPLGWVAWPLMFVPGVPHLGQKIYLGIARRRFQLVPCHNGVCSIPPKRS